MVPFRSYAKFRIRGAILDQLRRLDWATRDHRKAINAGAAPTASHVNIDTPVDDRGTFPEITATVQDTPDYGALRTELAEKLTDATRELPPR